MKNSDVLELAKIGPFWEHLYVAQCASDWLVGLVRGISTLALTNVILLFVYQMIFTALGVSFGLVGFHREDVTPEKEDGPPKSKRLLLWLKKKGGI